MKTYDNELRGAAFVNNRAYSPKAPAFKGFVEIEGRKFDIAIWPQKSKSGLDYLSLKLTPSDESNYQAPYRSEIIESQDEIKAKEDQDREPQQWSAEQHRRLMEA